MRRIRHGAGFLNHELFVCVLLTLFFCLHFLVFMPKRGKEYLKVNFPQLPPSVISLTPPLVVSVMVQCINQPIVRASITLQNPESKLPNIRSAVNHIYRFVLGSISPRLESRLHVL